MAQVIVVLDGTSSEALSIALLVLPIGLILAFTELPLLHKLL